MFTPTSVCQTIVTVQTFLFQVGLNAGLITSVPSVSSGMLVRLKGSVLRMAFLDSTGSQLPPAYEPWYEPNLTTDGEERVRKRRPVSVSPSTSQDLSESQYAVVCSEKQAKVISLPSQTCIYKHSITETSFLLRTDVVQMSQGACVACFCANGHIMTLR